MRRIAILFALFGLFLLNRSFAVAEEIIADSKISQVTVYPDSALISRVTQLKLNSGIHKIIFSDIIPELDENSIRVSAEKNAGVKILGAQLKREFIQDDPSARIKQLKEDIQKVEDEIRKSEDNKKILIEEKQFLDSIKMFSGAQIPKDLITKMPEVKNWDDTFAFLDAKLRDISSKMMDIELSQRESQKKLEVLRQQLSEISGPNKKIKRFIAVELETAKLETLDLQVSYLVRNAFWQPIYDARANFDKASVELVSYGIVKQSTGEDWPDIDISLSTAKPSVGGNMPYVEPWFLRPYQPHQVMKSLGFAGRAKMEISQQSEAFDNRAEMMVETPMEDSRVEEKGIAVVYNLNKKATIKSDGSDNKLPISTQELAAKFEYSSYPRAVLNAYLGSRVVNAPNLQLLGGRVNIFLDGDFVGASGISNIGPGEEFDLYLGADDNVKVKKELIEKKVDETLLAGIPSPNKRSIFQYKLTVENYKSKKIHMKLFEAMPISQDDRIRVKLEKVSLEPKEKDWKDRKGVWLWELDLEPKQKQEIFYTFIVEHPRGVQVEGL